MPLEHRSDISTSSSRAKVPAQTLHQDFVLTIHREQRGFPAFHPFRLPFECGSGKHPRIISVAEQDFALKPGSLRFQSIRWARGVRRIFSEAASLSSSDAARTEIRHFIVSFLPWCLSTSGDCKGIANSRRRHQRNGCVGIWLGFSIRAR